LVPVATLVADEESVVEVAVVLDEDPTLLAEEQPADRKNMITSPARGNVYRNLLRFIGKLLLTLRFNYLDLLLSVDHYTVQ